MTDHPEQQVSLPLSQATDESHNSATRQEPLPTTEGMAARRVAWYVLDDILVRHKPLDIVIEQNKDFLSLSTRDRAFVRMMCATVLRRLGQIDDMIKRASKRDDVPSPPSLQTLLRLGVGQLAFLDTPDYAVVDTMVNLAAHNGLSRQKDFVNAVLREVGRNGQTWLENQDEVRMNTPAWLMEQWIRDYDLRTAAEIAQANLSQASLDISVKDQTMLQYWADTLDATILPTGTLRRASGGFVQDYTGFNDGMWWVQDAAAALAARLFGNVENQTVVDLCAAPGGKTAQLAAMGADVIAVDRSVGRRRRLEENLRRLRLDQIVKIETADASLWQPPSPVSAVLLDAPCSATGTARRNPDILHLKTAQDVERLIDVQERLLDNAISMLKPGGVLVYCTCSLQKAEGEYQITNALKRHKTLRRLPISPEEVGGVEGILNEKGEVRALPFHIAPHGGLDGFFVSRLTVDS